MNNPLETRTDQELIQELLLQWEEAREDGRSIDAESLCADWPHLRDKVSVQIRKLRVFNETMDSNVTMDFDATMDTSLCADDISTQRSSESVQTPVQRTLEIPGYEILECVGRGGMGVVYRARQTALDRIVAVKTMSSVAIAPIHSDSDLEAADVLRFRREAETAATLKHPNIVAIHDVGESNGLHYITMDFLSGKTLSEMVRESSLPPKQAAYNLAKIAGAMEVAHRSGILHRDLKPSNVIFDGDDNPVVTDFGLAKRIDDDSNQTMSGQVLGTPSFMPPEQASGQIDKIDQRSDVYALGGVLYAMLTGRPPFRSDSAVATVMQVIDESPVAPRQLNSKIPQDLETICLKCLEKSPKNRYASAAEIVEECDRFLQGKPIHARPISTAASAWRWAQRNPMIAALAACSVVLLIAGTATSTAFAISANRNLTAAKANAVEAQLNFVSMKAEKMRADESHAVAIEEKQKAVVAKQDALESARKATAAKELALSQAQELERQADRLTEQQQTLEKSIQSYLQMYQNICKIGGDVAASDDAKTAVAAFAKFNSQEQMVTNQSIRAAIDAIEKQVDQWRQSPENRPDQLEQTVIRLADACRNAWNTRCKSTFLGRGAGRDTPIQKLERNLIIKTVYDDAVDSARKIARSPSPKLAKQSRDRFECLYWCEIRFVANQHVDSAPVQTAMDDFQQLLAAWHSGPPPQTLAQSAARLSATCAKSLEAASVN